MKKLAVKIKVPIDRIKETPWSTIVFFSVLYCIYVSFVNLVVFKFGFLESVSRLTFGLINETLIVNIFSVVVFIFIIILRCGKLCFYDLGLKKNKLFIAIIAMLTLWIFIQLLNAIITLIISEKLIINSDWNKHGASIMLGNFIAQIFGNCFFEELAFRGFLLIQICKKFKGEKSKFFTCVVGSQIIFALIHIPNRISSGMNVVNILISLIAVLIIGVLFAITYLVTDNIFLVIGIHALWNTPLLVFDGPVSTLVILIFIFLLLISRNRTFARLSLNKSKERDNSLNK